MNPKFYLLAILIILGANLNGQAQVSYNKRAIGSIGTLPKASDFLNSASLDNVDMSTGTLKVGIPLYEIKVNDISVPITLNYSALGLKVGQEAGPTGMGWELSAGGKIITNIQGKKDTEPLTGIQSNPLPSETSLDPYNNLTHRDRVGKIIDGKMDGAWDTYNYILPNGGGSYVKNGLTFPYDPFITIEHPGVIKTTDGLIYSFSPGDKKKSAKKTYFATASPTPGYLDPDQRWADPGVETEDRDLSTIVSTRFKDTVFFSYDIYNAPHAKLGAKSRTTTSESLPLYRDVRARSYTDGGVLSDAEDQNYIIKEPIVSQSKIDFLRHTRIRDINFTNGRVTFRYRPDDVAGRDVLDSVNIYQKVNNVLTQIKKYIFEYDESNLEFGHYLLAIHIYDSKNVWQGAWDFSYYDKLPLIPNGESKAQDRWGFYNGIETNKTLLDYPDSVLALKIRAHYPIVSSTYAPASKFIRYTRLEAKEFYGNNNNPSQDPVTGEISYTIDFANRKFDFSKAIKGTIKSIKTPTGGIFEYEYEPHKFQYLNRPVINNSNLETAIGGGIRIKTITKKLGHDSLYYGYANAEKTFQKKYKYGTSQFSSSSDITDTIGYATVTVPGVVVGNISAYYETNGSMSGIPINNMMLLSHPVNNMSQYNGSYGIYGSVVEYLINTDYTNVTYGKTVYFSNALPDGYQPDAPWRNRNYNLEETALPILTINAGVNKEFPVGIAGFKKYSHRRDGTFKPVEETQYLFRTFNAPLTSANKLVSFFGTITGQMSGPYPVTPGLPVAKDDPYQASRGGLIVYLFNATKTAGNGGMMDYIAKTNIIQEEHTVTYPGKYAISLLDLNTLSSCVRKEKELTTIVGDDGLTALTTDTKYYYDNPAHLLPTRTAMRSSLGDSTFTRTKYPQDYNPGGGTAIDFMKTNKIGLSEPIEEFSIYRSVRLGNTYYTQYLKNATLNTFREMNGSVYNSKIYKMNAAGDVVGNSGTSSYNGNESSISAIEWKPQLTYDLYLKGNVHKYTELQNPGNVVLWGYNNQYPIAKISNSNSVLNGVSADVAYTSFETRDNGNWNYSGSATTDITSPSGKMTYSLSSGSITKGNTTIAGKYILSYWCKTGAVISVSGGTAGTAVVKNTSGNWSLIEREVTNVTGILTISGTGSIDELRFHPYDSQMTTYLYEPLIGVTSVIDPKGNVQYYEYDNSQRLKNIKDQKGNIVKSYRYNMGTLN